MGSKQKRENLIKQGRTLHTFKEWKTKGLSVRKGEKSPCRNEYGQALFTDEQVYSYQWIPQEEEYDGIKYEEDIDFWKKVDPIALYDRIKKYDIKTSDEDWRSICHHVQKVENGG